MRGLSGSFDMPDEVGKQYRRRTRADDTALHDERKALETQLTELAADDTTAPDPDLVRLLPEVTASLADLPPDLQDELFAVFDIQIICNAIYRRNPENPRPRVALGLLAVA